MHLHGKSDFWVLAEGIGEWDGTIRNPLNPQRRDSQQLGPGTVDVPAFIVIQWETDNPGIWPFHCHVSTHASAGLYVNFLVSLPGVYFHYQVTNVSYGIATTGSCNR